MLVVSSGGGGGVVGVVVVVQVCCGNFLAGNFPSASRTPERAIDGAASDP